MATKRTPKSATGSTSTAGRAKTAVKTAAKTGSEAASKRAGKVVRVDAAVKTSAKAGVKSGVKLSVKSPVRGRKTAAKRVTRVAAPVEPAPASGTTSLVIVESPAKAKTIGKYLGRAYRVKATVGHVMDLPTKKLGIDVDNGFLPDYVPIPG